MAKSLGINQAAGLPGMLKDGYKHYEGVDDAVIRNINAAKQLAEIVKTSMGPKGRKKLVIDHLEKVLVTSDTATILKTLEVQHPAANILVQAAVQQETEFGNGTSLVVCFAGELLNLALELLRTGLHSSEIVEGYKAGFALFLDEIVKLEAKQLSDLYNKDELRGAILPVLGAKQEGYAGFLAPLVAEACLIVMPGKASGRRPSLNVESVRVCKLPGRSVQDSQVIRGMVISREAEGTIDCVADAKIAVFGCGVEASSTETKGTVLLHSAEELMNYNKGEERKLEEVIKSIAESGVNVVVSGGSISPMGLHFLEKYKIMAIKIASKFELRRLCMATSSTAMVRLGAPTAEEMGECTKVEVREVGGKKIVVFDQSDDCDTRLATILLRGSTETIMSDLERAIDDALNTVKALCRDPRMVLGAGATEMAISQAIQKYGKNQSGLDQYPITEYGTAFQIVPYRLAENAGIEPSAAVSKLSKAHENGDASAGLNLNDTRDFVSDAKGMGLYDPLAIKESAIRLATEAAITILRIDQIIMAKQAGGPKPRDMAAADNADEMP